MSERRRIRPANFSQDAYAVVGARIGAQTLDGHYRLEVWARNLFDQRSWSILNNTTLQPGIGSRASSSTRVRSA